MIVDGVEPWEEFKWVGNTIKLGDVTLRVLSRTVRCDGVSGTGLDVPKLLQKHFPEHGPYLGIYAQVVEGGMMRIGDGVQPPPQT